MKLPKHKRKGVSEVLATVILIAITLIAGVAIASFAFGLFGSLGTTANVSQTSIYCSIAVGNCIIGLKNTGGASATVSAYSMYGRAGTVLSLNPSTGVAPGSAAAVTCGAPIAVTAGEPVNGMLTLSSGISIAFAGFWSS